ncbi:MAG TPA: ATP-binding protein [Bacteroidales bacterium]|jgi:predicted HTH transcriptional regulator|nr:ATP-binding protein [Bacteroidales bacterium]HNV95424.1 ATP-binding protein [Bacteroidales bacterium]HOU97810.1 ATP-binding protein [Bacteroidales bacterium]
MKKHHSDENNYELFKLIKQGENQYLDFKQEIDDARKIARAMAAFANADGGRLLIGVKDNGNIAGIRSEEEMYMLQAAAEYYTKPKINYTLKQWFINKKTVLEAFIPPSKKSPHFVQNEKNEWKAYLRVDDQNIVLEPIVVNILKEKNANKPVFLQYGDDENKILSLLQTHKNLKADDIARDTLLPHSIVKNVLTSFALLKVVDYKVTINGTLFKLGHKTQVEHYLNQML